MKKTAGQMQESEIMADTSVSPSQHDDIRIPTAIPTLRNPARKERSKRHQRETFLQQLQEWALDHDSSVYFHGSIHLFPWGTFPRETLELGKSVNCILSTGPSGDLIKKIVIRLFRSQRHHSSAKEQGMQRRTESFRQYAAPYLLVIRSGSGWVEAREYFDRYHFLTLKKERKLASQHLAQACSNTNPQRIGWTRSVASNPSWESATQPPAAMANFVSNSQMSLLAANIATNVTSHIDLVGNQSFARSSLSSNNSIISNRNCIAEVKIPRKRSDFNILLLQHAKHDVLSFYGKNTVTISPSFRPFLRLPQELQDEILYQAIGYTRDIFLTRKSCPRDSTSPSKASTTISKLFCISKSINEHIIPHIYRSTNFHFGITGFTKFLWQLGPVNRSNLQHVTFHFGTASLLHCIRWLAPDPVWEIFEPPVVTKPPTLVQFWRCQLQDLMKELHLLTVSIDVTDVPTADVPMLVKILHFVVGSSKHVYIIRNRVRSEHFTRDCIRPVHGCSTDACEPTWRDLCVHYYRTYKHERFHMKFVWTGDDAVLEPIMCKCMQRNKAFFDS